MGAQQIPSDGIRDLERLATVARGQRSKKDRRASILLCHSAFKEGLMATRRRRPVSRSVSSMRPQDGSSAFSLESEILIGTTSCPVRASNSSSSCCSGSRKSDTTKTTLRLRPILWAASMSPAAPRWPGTYARRAATISASPARERVGATQSSSLTSLSAAYRAKASPARRTEVARTVASSAAISIFLEAP